MFVSISDSNVIVMGDDVNLRKPGTYKIKYLCRDEAGLEAPPQQRVVVVTGKPNHSNAPSKADPIIRMEGRE